MASDYIVPAATGSTELPLLRTALPEMRIADGNGLPIPLAGWRGAVVVLNFWKSTSGPCLRELVFLDRLQGNFTGQPLQVVSVNEDNAGPDAVKAALQRQKVKFLRPFSDPGQTLAQTLGLRGVPTTLVIDKKGRQVLRLEGPYEWDRPEISAVLLGLVRE